MTFRFLLSALLAAIASLAPGNTPPAAPTITEPQVGRLVSPEDVHMETAPFSDADPGDFHRCTDWQIVRDDDGEVVWRADCAGGVNRFHIHLGDGEFEGSHAGRHGVLPETQYRLRARHRDNSGDPETEWSGWTERAFLTAPLSAILPLSLDRVEPAPAPELLDAVGDAAALPAGVSVRMENILGDAIVAFHGATPPAVAEPLPAHWDISVVVESEDTSNTLALPPLDIRYSYATETDKTVYVPALSLAPGARALFWVAANGSTWQRFEDDAEPQFNYPARGVPVPWRATKPGYQVEVASTGYQLPVAIAFVPAPGDGPESILYYVAELHGNIKAVLRNGTVIDYATGLLNFNPTGDFPGSGEQGIGGIAVDPETGDLFITLVYSQVPGATFAPHYPRVERLSSADGGLTMATRATVLDMAPETQGESHQISAVSFGPDGKLYVHNGDGFEAGSAMNLDSVRGKVLRMEKDGSAPADNPFFDAGDGITARDYVFAYGFRNPFGGAWRLSDGRLFCAENGPVTDRFAIVQRGASYGWTGDDRDMATNALYNWYPAAAPVGVGVIEPGRFGGSGFAPGEQGSIFVAESGSTYATGVQERGKSLSEFRVGASGELLGSPARFVQYIGTGKATAAAVAAGPDGLYFSDLYPDDPAGSPIGRGANILRIRYVGLADFAASAESGSAPLAVQFSDLSTVAEPTAWRWDFGDGATSTERHPAHVYADEGFYTVTLRVTGAGGIAVQRKRNFIVVSEGEGLLGEYYNNTDFTNLALRRVDPEVSFQWGNFSPDPVMGAETFAVRWRGQVQAQFTERYAFLATADDGVRLWVDGQPIIDEWRDQPLTEFRGEIDLEEGRKYDLTMEYYEAFGAATAQLRWESASQVREIVPRGALFAPADVSLSAAVDDATPAQGQAFRLTLAAKNSGIGKALKARFELPLPAGIEFAGASIPAAADGGVVACDLGKIARNTQVAFTVDLRVATAFNGGPVALRPRAYSESRDLAPANNAPTVSLTVPVLSMPITSWYLY